MAEIKLGAHVLPLVPVSIPRARRGITRALNTAGLSTGDLAGMSFASLLGAGEQVLYELLCTLVPGLKARMPFYEFAGFPSQAAMDAGDFDEDASETVAPTSAEVQEALAAAWEVSKIGRLIQPVSKAVDPTALRAIVTGLLEDGAKAASSTISRSSNGEFRSTSGSTLPAPVSPSNGSTGFSPDVVRP